MPTYRLLLFRGSRLDHWEEFEAEDHLDAVRMASGRSRDKLTELWLGSSRIAVFRPRTHSDAIG